MRRRWRQRGGGDDKDSWSCQTWNGINCLCCWEMIVLSKLCSAKFWFFCKTWCVHFGPSCNQLCMLLLHVVTCLVILRFDSFQKVPKKAFRSLVFWFHIWNFVGDNFCSVWGCRLSRLCCRCDCVCELSNSLSFFVLRSSDCTQISKKTTTTKTKRSTGITFLCVFFFLFFFQDQVVISLGLPAFSLGLPASLLDFLPLSWTSCLSLGLPASLLDFLPLSWTSCLSLGLPAFSLGLPASLLDFLPSLLDFLPSLLDFLPSLLDFLPSLLDFLPSLLDFLPLSWTSCLLSWTSCLLSCTASTFLEH